MSIEVIILTRNEERHIHDCLLSCTWADYLTVFDSGSSDRTIEIAKAMGARVLQHPFRNFGDQRNAALAAAQADWVLFIDADERCTPALAAEARCVCQQTEDGWWLPRENYLFGQVIRHTGWYPDYQLRFLRRNCARYDDERPVHETVMLKGEAGKMQATLIHYNYDNLRQFLRKQMRYAPLEAQSLYLQGVRPKLHSPIAQPIREFKRRFIDLQGYKDGVYGLSLSLLMAIYNVYVYSKLLLLIQQEVKNKVKISCDR